MLKGGEENLRNLIVLLDNLNVRFDIHLLALFCKVRLNTLR